MCTSFQVKFFAIDTQTCKTSFVYIFYLIGTHLFFFIVEYCQVQSDKKKKKKKISKVFVTKFLQKHVIETAVSNENCIYF